MAKAKPVKKKEVAKKPATKGKASAPVIKAKKVHAEILPAEERDEADESLTVAPVKDVSDKMSVDEDSGDLESADEPSPSVAGSTKSLATLDTVSLYLAEIRKYALLSKEQEFELAKKYFETKDATAAQALVTANLRFVVKIAAEYSKFGARMIDLIQEGNMGLMHAVKDFNPYKGVRLITYAVWWIRGYIQEYLMKQYSMVKIGTTQNQKKLFYQLQKERDQLDALGHSPNVALLSSRLGIPQDEVEIMSQRMSGRDISLDAPLSESSAARLSDLQKSIAASPDEELSKNEEIQLLKTSIESLRPHLTDREKIILEERLLADEPLTLQEIGEKHGITREAVRQMEVRLMKKIKDRLQIEK